MAKHQDWEATAYYVFFIGRTTAEAFARQHGGNVAERDGGWVVEKAITQDADDPITRVIRAAVKDLPRDE